MKKRILVFLMLLLAPALRFAQAGSQILLDQVDKVSLYLSTDRIVYTPRLEEGMKLNMTITLLEVNYQPRSEVFKNFVSRHIETFNKTLKKRLALYAPELAKTFRPERDASFLIQVGADRHKAATVREGKWEWLDRQASLIRTPVAADTSPAASAPASRPLPSECKRRCPALLKKKPKPDTES